MNHLSECRRDLTRVPIDVDELLGLVEPHLRSTRDNAYVGRYRAARKSATQAVHRLLDLIERLQDLTEEDQRL